MARYRRRRGRRSCGWRADDVGVQLGVGSCGSHSCRSPDVERLVHGAAEERRTPSAREGGAEDGLRFLQPVVARDGVYLESAQRREGREVLGPAASSSRLDRLPIRFPVPHEEELHLCALSEGNRWLGQQKGPSIRSYPPPALYRDGPFPACPNATRLTRREQASNRALRGLFECLLRLRADAGGLVTGGKMCLLMDFPTVYRNVMLTTAELPCATYSLVTAGASASAACCWQGPQSALPLCKFEDSGRPSSRRPGEFVTSEEEAPRCRIKAWSRGRGGHFPYEGQARSWVWASAPSWRSNWPGLPPRW